MILVGLAWPSHILAQEPSRPPQQDPEPVDPAERAAEALRRLLRGEKPPTKPEEVKPGVEIPPGPEVPPEPVPEAQQQDPDKPPVVVPPPNPDPEFDAAQRALERANPGLERVEKPAEEVRDDPARASDPGLPPAAGEFGGAAQPALAASPLTFSGFFTLDWRYRRSSNDSKDQDLRGLLGFDVGNPQADFASFHFLGRGQLDIDGANAGEFAGVHQAVDDKWWGRVYEASLDFNQVPELSLVRLGRQAITDTPEVLYVDGLRVESEDMTSADIRLGGYIGLPTRWFDVSNGKLLTGIYGEARPWEAGRVRLDWTHSEDSRDGQDFDDDLLGFGIWQGIDDVAFLYGRYTMLNGKSRDAVFRADADFADIDLRGNLGYVELISTQTRLSIEFDPFWDQAFDLNPYRQVSASLTKGIGEDVDLTGGVDIRRLTNLADEGQFNRDFERYYATLFWDQIADADVSFSLTFDAYRTQIDETTAWSADIAAQLTDELRGQIGSDFSLYDYDFFSQSERDRVRVFFIRFDYALTAPVKFRLDYRYEDIDQTDRYHVVETRMTWNF